MVETIFFPARPGTFPPSPWPDRSEDSRHQKEVQGPELPIFAHGAFLQVWGGKGLVFRHMRFEQHTRPPSLGNRRWQNLAELSEDVKKKKKKDTGRRPKELS